MSDRWFKDINTMHHNYGVHKWVRDNKEDKELMLKYLSFRMDFIEEEFKETLAAIYKDKDPEEVVDGLIDIMVVALGTLDAFGVDAEKAWNEVHRANSEKQPGVKEERPNPLGLPDLIKPLDWKAPSHEGNHGLFENVLADSI